MGGTCAGEFEASEACCACSPDPDVNKLDFCCAFMQTSPNQGACEAFVGSKLEDASSTLAYSMSKTFTLSKQDVIDDDTT